jgi:hypothetical protein
LYALVRLQLQNLEGIPEEVDESAAEAIEEFDEEAPLLASRRAQSSIFQFCILR